MIASHNSAAGAGAAGGAIGAGATGGAASAGAAGGAAGAGAAGAAGPGGAHTGGTGAAGTGGTAGVGAAGTEAGGAAGVVTGDPGAEGTGAVSALQPSSPLLGPSPYSGPTRGLTECREPESRPVSPMSRAASPVRTGRVLRPRPPPVPCTHSMTLRPSTAPQRVPLPSPPASSLPDGPDLESDSLCAATCCLDYATSLAAESACASLCPPSVGGECALGTDVLEDRQEEFECFATAVPHLVSMLLSPEGDPDAPDIPTPRSYAEAIEGPYSSQWQTVMDAEMASWKSTGTYVDEVPPPGANIVSGMWIFTVKRPPGSPPVFKARYIARGFSQQQGVDFFQTFSPTPKMTTLRVLLHFAAQRDYELHSLDFSTAFLQGSLHEEIWLRHPPGFTGSFPAGTQWSLRRPVYGLRQAPREWHDTLRTTLIALGFAPSTADTSLFLRTYTTLPQFYVLVYVDDLVFATADPEALAHVKSELQKRHTCTNLGPSALRLHVLLATVHSSAYRTLALSSTFGLVRRAECPISRACGLPHVPDDLHTTCPRIPLSLLARYVAPGRHRKVHWNAAKRVLRYLCSTSGMGLVLGGRARVVLTGHADASWVDDLATKRSSQGYTFSLGSGSVSWRSTRSSSVLSSSCEAEIYVGVMATQELRWLTYLLTDLGEAPRSPPVLYVVNKVMLALCQEHRLEHRTKHIALRYFLARELQQRGQLRLAYVASQANTADVFTKALQPSARTAARSSNVHASTRSSRPGEQQQYAQQQRRTHAQLHAHVHQPPARAAAARARAQQTHRGGPGGGRGQQQQRRSETQTPQQLREWLVQRGAGEGSETCPYVIRTGARAGRTCGKFHTERRCFARLDDAWHAEFGDDVERPRWAQLLQSGVAIFDLDFDVIISAMYALSFSAEGDCYQCVPPDPGIAATALGASASRTPPGTAPAEALHNFTLDSGASRFVASSSTVLPCPAVPSGSLSDLHPPSFSTNLVSTAALQDAMVTTTSPGGSILYTLATKPPQVAASAQVSASGQVAASCSCRLLSDQTLLWHHRLGHPSLPRLRGMHSRLLVSGLPRSLPPLPPSPAPPCLPCIEGQQRAAPHSSFPPTSAPLQTLHMDVTFLCPPPDQSQPPLQPAPPLPAPSPYTEQSGGLTERREPASRPVLPVRTARRAPRSRPPPVLSTHAMALRPSSVPLRDPLPAPPESSLPEVPDPESDRARVASPTVARLLATAVTDPFFESAAASALVAELLDFASAYRLDYATALLAESVSASPPSVGGECALGTDVLEDRQKAFECLAAAVPRFASMLLALKGDSDAPDIPTLRSYAEAITGPYSSEWQAAMDAEMASWKSAGTYVDEVPPPGANIVDGMWIFRVKQSSCSPPAFKARYVARGFSQRQGVDYFQTFSPTPKMTTLRMLLHVAAQRDYELHSLDFSTAFLQGSLHEDILTTLTALGFAPSTTDTPLFLRTDTSLPPFYVLVYVDDLVFATADIEALTLVKSELQKRHICTDVGELRSYLGLQITRDRARRTTTLTQSHMVNQVLQRFGFQYSSPQLTPLSTSHTLSAPPSDESVEPSGPYPELVGCLMYLMTCTRPDLAYPLSLLAHYVAPGRHRKVHWDAAKRVLRYLCSTSGMGLVLGGPGPVVLTGHADASWVDDSATQRSSQGYTFSLDSGSVSWRSTRSSSVLSSSCEVEIYAGAMAAQELR
ncbi:unnamed protein product [Closterium sp. NIES-53]